MYTPKSFLFLPRRVSMLTSQSEQSANEKVAELGAHRLLVVTCCDTQPWV